MNDKITFNDLKDEDALVKFLEKVWRAGIITALLNPKYTSKELREKFMPNFREQLKREGE